ncbi:translocon-associated protein subunit alpha-like [Clytia hemisphaerica]|uniref:Translocon-associated protein subunit alpha n=1 Tax=Clytia hemisphaerica TaxID=252671 RepID=A0A7M5XE45_9CNID|eukprot:TCONS_00070306-protein
MFKYLTLPLLLAVLLLPTSLVFVGRVSAQEDAVEDEVVAEEGEDSKVEAEDEEPAAEETSPTGKDAEDEEEQVGGVRMTSDAVTSVLFPDYPEKDLPAGKPLHLLVGLQNKGEKEFTIQTIDASFRYPQDYNYFIQNFTAISYNSVVEPGSEATFRYSFFPHESYGGRPFGLTILMFFKDTDGNQYGAGVFNETVTLKELDENFDGETFFLYVLLVAVALLVVFGINYVVSNKFKRSSSKPKTETGTTNDKNDVDYDWLPKTTTDFKASPRRQSPRQRRVKRSTGSGEE